MSNLGLNHRPLCWGFDHLTAGSSRPVLAVYGEHAWNAASQSQLTRFVKIGLPRKADAARDHELEPLWRKLTARTVVILPEPTQGGPARAERHAARIAAHGAVAVGIVIASGDTFYVDDAVDEAFSAASALALPVHDPRAARRTRAVAPVFAPVDGAALFARLRSFLSRHLAEPQTTIDAVALWCLHAWAHDAFDVSPRLILHASDPRAHHARALRLAAWLTPTPLVVSRTIAAHLLPVIAADKPTLLLDDVGGTMLTYVDMRALIAAGALKDGAFLSARTRTNPSGWSPCFAPTAIATAARLPADVAVRAIVLAMSPPANDTPREPLALSDPPQDVARLRAEMQRWTKDARRELAQPSALMPAKLDPAARDNWYPLLALAERIGDDALHAVTTAMRTLCAAARRLSTDLELLDDVRELVGAIDAEARIPTLELLAKLVSDPERAWATAHRGRKLTAKGLADRLDRFGLKPIMMRLPGGGARGYRGDALLAAFARYLGDPLELDQVG